MKNISLYFETGYLLDSSYLRASTNQKVIAALIPKFQESWNEWGRGFIEAALKEIGKEFRRNELLAYLIMHPEVLSCSHPFLININQFLNFNPGSYEEATQFSELVFHELLHVYLDDNFSELLNPQSAGASDLIKRFAMEDDIVTSHLHLYAIQKHVFAKTEWISIWDRVVEKANTLHSSGYRRAIEIVGSIGSAPFVEELRKTK